MLSILDSFKISEWRT